jgi:hypothetical protein
MSEGEAKKVVEDAEAPAPEKVATEGRSRRGPRGGEKTCYNCGKVRTN